jgi:hypothetical protein
LAFSDPNGITEWSDPDTLPPWDLDVERKRRLWKPFWNRIIETDEELSGRVKTHEGSISQVVPEPGPPSTDGKKSKKSKRRLSMVDAPDGSGVKVPYAAQRWEETLETLRIRGFQAFESSLLPISPQDMHIRLWLQAVCEGPDIYCDDKWICDPNTSATKDGTLNSVNGFGRLEIEAYPYCCKVYWDGGGHDYCKFFVLLIHFINFE